MAMAMAMLYLPPRPPRKPPARWPRRRSWRRSRGARRASASRSCRRTTRSATPARTNLACLLTMERARMRLQRPAMTPRRSCVSNELRGLALPRSILLRQAPRQMGPARGAAQPGVSRGRRTRPRRRHARTGSNQSHPRQSSCQPTRRRRRPGSPASPQRRLQLRRPPPCEEAARARCSEWTTLHRFASLKIAEVASSALGREAAGVHW
eukprot:SM000045S16175  [mRNA]  locus=s45:95349:96405:+ [translate_table: standard]